MLQSRHAFVTLAFFFTLFAYFFFVLQQQIHVSLLLDSKRYQKPGTNLCSYTLLAHLGLCKVFVN